MAIPLAVLIFFSVLGLLVVLYALHFRRRALSMGPERLLAALSRTVAGEGEASELELRQGVLELETRLQRAFLAVTGALAVVLVICLVLTAMSKLPGLSFALSGLGIFLVACVLSIILLRDLPRHAGRQLDKQASHAPQNTAS